MSIEKYFLQKFQVPSTFSLVENSYFTGNSVKVKKYRVSGVDIKMR